MFSFFISIVTHRPYQIIVCQCAVQDGIFKSVSFFCVCFCFWLFFVCCVGRPRTRTAFCSCSPLPRAIPPVMAGLRIFCRHSIFSAICFRFLSTGNLCFSQFFIFCFLFIFILCVCVRVLLFMCRYAKYMCETSIGSAGTDTRYTTLSEAISGTSGICMQKLPLVCTVDLL